MYSSYHYANYNAHHHTIRCNGHHAQHERVGCHYHPYAHHACACRLDDCTSRDDEFARYVASHFHVDENCETFYYASVVQDVAKLVVIKYGACARARD